MSSFTSGNDLAATGLTELSEEAEVIQQQKRKKHFRNNTIV